MKEKDVSSYIEKTTIKVVLLTAFAPVHRGKQKEQEGSFADGENSHALRLENVSLREPLSDLRAANANPYRALIGARGFALSTKKREVSAKAPTSQSGAFYHCIRIPSM